MTIKLKYTQFQYGNPVTFDFINKKSYFDGLITANDERAKPTQE